MKLVLIQFSLKVESGLPIIYIAVKQISGNKKPHISEALFVN